MDFSYKVHGLRELGQKLARLDATIQKKEARAAVRAGAAVIRRQAVVNARAAFTRRSGNLFRAFGISVKRRGAEFLARIFVNRRRAFYALFLFGGWRAIGRGKGRRAQLRRGSISGKRIAGKPVLRDALAQAAPAAIEAVKARLAQGIQTFR